MDSGSGAAESSDTLDPARKYGNPQPDNRNNFLCTFCGKLTKGGAYRMKQHLVGGFRNVTKCARCPEHVREEVQAFMIKKAQAKNESEMYPMESQFVDVDEYDDEEEECEITSSKKGGKSRSSKRPRSKGPIDLFFTRTANPKKEVKGIYKVIEKELREKSCRAIARFFYDAGIPFNAATYPSFGEMCEAIGQYGPGLKPPSMHELRVPLLKKEVEDTESIINEHKKEWTQVGCSILSDGWRDSVAQKDIVNLLVNSPKGSMFIKSLDVSEIVKDARMLFDMLDKMVEEVGEHNVIQVVTDNASNYVKAGKKLLTLFPFNYTTLFIIGNLIFCLIIIIGKLLEDQRPHLYWTPCAAHCLDLMLEDIGKIPKVKIALKKCIYMNGYIYSHISLVNMMRRFTNQRNLHRPAVTRFATSFITLAQYHKQKANLRKMVTSEEWNQSKWPKDAGGKK